MSRKATWILALLAAACGGDDAAAPDAAPDARATDAPIDVPVDANPLDPSRLSPSCWTGGATTQLDLAGPVENWTWNDPHVLRSGAAYWMYASATDAFQYPVRSYRLTSDDGETWALPAPSPILADADAGAWDAGGVETPAVVHFAGRYHLFYTAYPHVIGTPEHAVTDYRIGHAVSEDGATFTRVGVAPVVAPSGTTPAPADDWYQYIVAEPAPLVRGDTLYLYFSAIGVDATLGSLQVIGMISTTDGVTWTAPVRVLAPDQTLYPRGADWVGYSTPNAIELGGEVHLFVDVASQPPDGAWSQRRIHHASSADGATAWRTDATAIRAVGDLSWAQDEIHSPAAFLDGTTLRLYLAGRALAAEPAHFGIGMLTCDLTRS